MKRFAKFLSLALATVIAVSVFTVNSNAMSATAEAHRRDLTAEEIQTISTLFKADQYAKMYPDVVKVLGEDESVLFNHFINYGIWEQRQPSMYFNVDAYASSNYDLQPVFGDDIIGWYMHYCTYSKVETWRRTPTVQTLLWNNCSVYSVYDFVKGQQFAKAGAVPIATPGYHPGYELK